MTMYRVVERMSTGGKGMGGIFWGDSVSSGSFFLAYLIILTLAARLGWGDGRRPP